MRNIGYGQGYKYAHELENRVADMQCLPDNLRERQYYFPTSEGIERRIRERLEEIKRLKTALPPQEPEAPARSKQRPKKES
jgi:putative ATPase